MERKNQKNSKRMSINVSWKVIFILLLIVNVVFYLSSKQWFEGLLSGSLRGESTLVYFSLATTFNIINTLVVSLYIWKRHPQGKAKVISYLVLIFLALRMASGIFFLFWMVIGSIR
jgi:hypothetical protein